MSMVEVDQEARQIVAALTEDQRTAVYEALYAYDAARCNELERSRPSFTAETLDLRRTTQVSPARRRPGWLEAIKGVQCCDPAVRASWALWRVCFITIGLIVLVAASAAVVYGSAGVGIVLLVLFVVCAAVSKSITGGSASVCH